METTESSIGTATPTPIHTPSPLEISPSEVGHSLLAMAQVHSNPDLVTPTPAPKLSHSRQMAEMYAAISELLDYMHQRLAATGVAPLDQITQRIEASELRQLEILEATLKQWASERESQAAEHLLEIESLQIQAQMEVNRLLRVMWLGTGLAAAGAGTALFLFRT